MRPVELADRHVMGHELPKSLALEPGVEMECGRLDLERRSAQLREIKIDRMIGRGADRAWTAREQGQGRPMYMSAGDELDSRMAPDDRGQLVGVMQILAIHVPDTCSERRVVQEQERRSIG